MTREQQQTQSVAGAVNGNGTDLLSYVQMQRNLRCEKCSVEFALPQVRYMYIHRGCDMW